MRISAIVLAAALAAAAPAPAQSQSPPPPSVTIAQPWARATAPNARNGAAYMTLSPVGGAADRLLSASSPAAEKVELHTVTRTAAGVMEMREVPAIEVAPGVPTVLQPGGYHVMLMGLKEPLRQGASLPLTLNFERSGTVRVTVPIGAAGAMHGGH